MKLLVCEDFDNVNAPTTRAQLNNGSTNTTTTTTTSTSSSNSSSSNTGNNSNPTNTRVRSNSVGSAAEATNNKSESSTIITAQHHGSNGANNNNSNSNNNNNNNNGGSGSGGNTKPSASKKKSDAKSEDEVGPFRAVVSSDTFIGSIRLNKKGTPFDFRKSPKILAYNGKTVMPKPLTAVEEVEAKYEEFDIMTQPPRFNPDQVDEDVFGQPHLYMQYESEEVLLEAYEILMYGLEFHPQFAYHDRELVIISCQKKFIL
jgi:hypothetical protein